MDYRHFELLIIEIDYFYPRMIILLFIREKNRDEFGNTMGYVFLGDGKLSESSGSKPMNIKWELNEPIPPYLWKDSAKMAVG